MDISSETDNIGKCSSFCQNVLPCMCCLLEAICFIEFEQVIVASNSQYLTCHFQIRLDLQLHTLYKSNIKMKSSSTLNSDLTWHLMAPSDCGARSSSTFSLKCSICCCTCNFSNAWLLLPIVWNAQDLVRFSSGYTLRNDHLKFLYKPWWIHYKKAWYPRQFFLYCKPNF